MGGFEKLRVATLRAEAAASNPVKLEEVQKRPRHGKIERWAC